MSEDTDKLLSKLDARQLVATVPSGLFLVDLEQKITYWNAEAERITGFKAEEVLGRHCSLLEGIECDSNCRLFDQSVAKPAIGGVCRIQSKSGKILHLMKNVDYLRDEDGEVIGGIESFNDVTSLTETQERLESALEGTEQAVRERTLELETERTWLHTVLDTMVDFAYICSDDYRILYMNRAMVEELGDHVGELCHVAIHQRDSVCDYCPMQALHAGNVVRQERVFADPDKTYEVIHTPLMLPDGTSQKLSIFRDITERKEGEEQLKAANRELDAFVYTVSHDLRTPLTPIIGFAEFLADQYREQLDAQALDILQEIENQGKRMLSLMEDLLSLAKVGSLKAPQEPVDTAALAQEVLHELQGKIAECSASISVGELPSLRIPETLLLQIFANLIGNALRYGGEQPKVEIGSQRARGQVRIFVRDHGPGVEPSEADKLFELFYRGGSSRQTKGTGLGLAIVRKIAEAFGGRARVEQTPGGGATFWVEFPDRGGEGDLAGSEEEQR